MERNNIIVFSWIVFSMIVLSFAMQIQLDKQKMEAHGIEIPTYVYEKGVEVSQDSPGFVVCNLEDNECLSFGRLPQ